MSLIKKLQIGDNRIGRYTKENVVRIVCTTSIVRAQTSIVIISK